MTYSTIVADPPWDYGKDRMVGTFGPDSGPMKHAELPYPTMSVDEIAALPVSSFAAPDSHLYLWTTQRYLPDAFNVLEAWGFSRSAVLVWSKPAMGIVGTFVCSAEFVLFGRRGKLPAKRKHLGTVFEWSRRGHSQKPEAFLDLVESISPGPYLELFARRNRLGWDTWGNESLEHVQIESAS